MSQFNPVTPVLIEKLKDVIGEKNVQTDPSVLDAYKTDEEGNPVWFRLPEVVVFPGTTEEVASIVKLANEYKVPITPRSAGTSVAGGDIPVYHGIVMVMTRMNKIIKIDKDNLYAIVQPGVLTSEVQQAAKDKGLIYAGDPCSATSCMIGGNICTNAGGDHAVKYGVTRNQIYGMEWVTPTGEITRVGQRLQKCSSGYCMEQLICGAEGTLGVITEITLKLQPKPKYRADLVAVFKDDKAALKLPNKLRLAGIEVTCMEWMDYESIKLTGQFIKAALPHAESKCSYVITAVETFNEEMLDDELMNIDEVARQCGAFDVLVIKEDSTVWQARKAYAEAAREACLSYYAEDYVVPLDKINELMEFLPKAEKNSGIRTMTVAHIGDGNIHTDLMNYDNLPAQEWSDKVEAFHDVVYPKVYELGGRMSGEHGIGFKKVDSFKKYTDPVLRNAMMQIKRALDPNNIMNPGKIFDIDKG